MYKITFFQSHFSRTSFVLCHSSSSLSYSNGSSFSLLLPPAPSAEDERRDREAAFSKALGKHFEPFEIEVHFHLRRIVAAR